MEFTGSITALLPSRADAERLTTAGGDPNYTERDMHLTLTYVGGEFVTDTQIDRNVEAIRKASKTTSAFEARVAGSAYLGDDKAVVALMEAYNINDIRDRLSMYAPKPKFAGFIPHITLAYDTERSMELVFNLLPEVVTFTHIAVFTRGARYTYPLN